MGEATTQQPYETRTARHTCPPNVLHLRPCSQDSVCRLGISWILQIRGPKPPVPPQNGFVQLNFELNRPAPGSLFTMSLLPRPIILLLLAVQLASYGSCIFLNKQNSVSGLKARPEIGRCYNGSLLETTDASILFARQNVCSNGVTTCSGYTCDKCDSCCAGAKCSAFSFGTCCSNGESCDYGLECWYQISGSGTGCCPPGLTGCFTTPFSCCNPGSTCGSTGCVGTP